MHSSDQFHREITLSDTINNSKTQIATIIIERLDRQYKVMRSTDIKFLLFFFLFEFIGLLLLSARLHLFICFCFVWFLYFFFVVPECHWNIELSRVRVYCIVTEQTIANENWFFLSLSVYVDIDVAACWANKTIPRFFSFSRQFSIFSAQQFLFAIQKTRLF